MTRNWRRWRASYNDYKGEESTMRMIDWRDWGAKDGRFSMKRLYSELERKVYGFSIGDMEFLGPTKSGDFCWSKIITSNHV